MESNPVFQNVKEKIFSEFSDRFFTFEVKGKTYLINKEMVLWITVDHRYIAVHFEAKRLIINNDNTVYYETEEFGSQ